MDLTIQKVQAGKRRVSFVVGRDAPKNKLGKIISQVVVAGVEKWCR